ncbi:hypothetical protein Peur_013004 [Populus x canadensis]
MKFGAIMSVGGDKSATAFMVAHHFFRLGRGGLGDDTSSWTYSVILLNKAGYLLLCNFLFVQRLPVGQNYR